MFGHSFKLLGLATMNIFIALGLSSAFLSHTGNGKLQTLTEKNVGAFLTDVADITAGKRADMDQYAVTAYFMDHVADDGAFQSTLRYNLPDPAAADNTAPDSASAAKADNEHHVTMDKKTFIAGVLQDMHKDNHHDADMKIEYIKINDGGRTATAVTTDYEHGVLPVADGSGEANMTPVSGTSYCEQTLRLSDDHVIQITGANCTTDVALSDSN